MGPGLDLGNLLVHLRLNDSQFMRSLRGVEKKVLLTANKMVAIGRTMSMRVTLPILAIGAAAVKTFADLEEGFIGVQKTVNATAEEFVVLRRELEQLSKTTPSSLKEIFGAAEIGGQLGIATENLVDFTNTIIMMKNTSDLSIDAAAKQFARFANIVQMPQKNISNLASTLTELGNNSAATEGEIITLAMRIAATGNRVGLTSAEIVGMAASLTSLGVQAEMGGSGISRLFVELNKAAKNGTRELREFAKVAGMSREEFQKLFNMSAREGILAYVEGLQRMQEAGIELSPTLDKVGLSGVRLNDVMGRLSGSGTLTRRMMTDATKAWKENTATVDEANKKYASFWSQLKITKNMFVLMAQDIGKVLEPMVLSLNETVRKASEWWFSLNEAMKENIVQWALYAAAVGPALIVVWTLIKASLMLKGAVIAIAGFSAGLFPVVGVLVLVGTTIYTLATIWRNNFMGMRDVAQDFLLVNRTMWSLLYDITSATYDALTVGWYVHFDNVLARLKDFVANFLANISAIAKVAAASLDVRTYLKGEISFGDIWAEEFVKAHEKVTSSLTKTGEDVKITWKAFLQTLNEESKKKFDEIGRNIGSIREIGGTVFGDLWHLNIMQAKVDLKNLSAWLKTLANDLGLSGNKSVANAIEEINKEIENLDATITNALKTTTESTKSLAESLKGFFAGAINVVVKQIEDTEATWDEWQASMASSLEQGLMNMAQDWDNWADYVKQILKEVYYEALRLAFIKPLATNMAEGFTSASKFGLDTIFKSLAPSVAGASIPTSGTVFDPISTPMTVSVNPPSGAEGGYVEKSGLALIHKGETLSGTEGQYGGNLTLKLHYEGQPLVVSKEQNYLQSDQRIKEVWLSLADNDMAVRNRLNRR